MTKYDDLLRQYGYQAAKPTRRVAASPRAPRRSRWSRLRSWLPLVTIGRRP